VLLTLQQSVSAVSLSSNTYTDARVLGLVQSPDSYSHRGLFGISGSDNKKSDCRDWASSHAMIGMSRRRCHGSLRRRRAGGRSVYLIPTHVGEGKDPQTSGAGRVQESWAGIVSAVAVLIPL
jgi:hypothetical protein